MKKGSTATKTKPAKDEAAKEKTSRENEKNFKLSAEAFRLVTTVQENRGNMSAFASKCIENYGPILLKDTGDSSDTNAPFSARFNYLEEAVIALTYAGLVNEEYGGWDSVTLKAHQKVLESANVKQWYNSKSLDKILAVAAKNSKTKDTEPYEWQTLLRRLDDFMAL